MLKRLLHFKIMNLLAYFPLTKIRMIIIWDCHRLSILGDKFDIRIWWLFHWNTIQRVKAIKTNKGMGISATSKGYCNPKRMILASKNQAYKQSTMLPMWGHTIPGDASNSVMSQNIALNDFDHIKTGKNKSPNPRFLSTWSTWLL